MVGDFRFLALLGMTRWWDCLVVGPVPHLWIADQVRNDGRGGWCCLVVAPPCGYCLEASMTPTHFTTLWIPAYAGMTVRYRENGGPGLGWGCGRVVAAEIYLACDGVSD